MIRSPRVALTAGSFTGAPTSKVTYPRRWEGEQRLHRGQPARPGGGGKLGEAVTERLDVADGHGADRLAGMGQEGADVRLVGADGVAGAAVQPEADQGLVAVGLLDRDGFSDQRCR